MYRCVNKSMLDMKLKLFFFLSVNKKAQVVTNKFRYFYINMFENEKENIFSAMLSQIELKAQW